MEDNEEDDEGEDLPDSLGAFVKEDIQDPDDNPDPRGPDDGMAEFQRTVSFWEDNSSLINGSGSVIN